MCGCSGGVCVVALGGCVVAPWGRGRAWLLQGGMCGCSVGVCVVAPEGGCACPGGMHGKGGHAW